MRNFIFFILLSFFSAWVNSATLVFNDGFESGSLSSIYNTSLATPPYASFIASSAQKSSGVWSARAYLERTDSTQNNYRAEVVLGRISGESEGVGIFNFGQEYWFGMNVRYEDWVPDVSDFSPFQIHLRPSSWEAACQVGSAWGWAPFYMWTGGGNMGVNVNRVLPSTSVSWQQPLTQKKWYSVVVRFIPDRTGSQGGRVEIWVDNVKVINHFGQNNASNDNCGVPFLAPVLKIGIYKWDWKSGRPLTAATKRIVFIDNIKIARGTNGYNDVYTATGTVPPPDTTPPTLSSVAVSNILNDRATITWNTNEASDSRVDYGLTTAYGSNSSDAASVTTHGITLTGLQTGTLYNFKASSKDSSNNTGNSANYSFTTTSTDVTKPVISNIQSSVTSTTATITWDTNEPATSRVKFISPITNSQYTADLVTSHSITFTGLTPNTVHTYKVTSVDGSGNLEETPTPLSLTTAAQTVEPIISAETVTTITATTATITWTTNVATDSSAHYGLTVNTNIVAHVAESVTSHSMTLTGLIPNKKYYIKVRSANVDGEDYSTVLTFRTKTKSGFVTDEFNSWLDPIYFLLPMDRRRNLNLLGRG